MYAQCCQVFNGTPGMNSEEGSCVRGINFGMGFAIASPDTPRGREPTVALGLEANIPREPVDEEGFTTRVTAPTIPVDFMPFVGGITRVGVRSV